MAAVKLLVCDLLRSTAANIHSSTTGYTTAPRAVDGNPAAQWSLGATSGSFICNQASAVRVAGFAVANHNAAGATFTLYSGSSATGPWTSMGGCTPATNEDFVYCPESGFAATATYFKLGISGGSANLYIGEVSFFGDYGYNSSGAEITSAGGILSLANEAGFGVVEPIARSIEPSIAEVAGATGIRRRIFRGSPEEVLTFRFADLRTAADLEWWKVVRSYTWPTKTAKTNPRWRDGLWVTPTAYSAASGTTLRGYYVDLIGPLAYEEDRLGRASGVLTFRERNHG